MKTSRELLKRFLTPGDPVAWSFHHWGTLNDPEMIRVDSKNRLDKLATTLKWCAACCFMFAAGAGTLLVKSGSNGEGSSIGLGGFCCIAIFLLLAYVYGLNVEFYQQATEAWHTGQKYKQELRQATPTPRP
jgi:hypothetical protein